MGYSIRNNNKSEIFSLYRIICCFEIFLLHYLAANDLREYCSLFVSAVPSFILISAYLYNCKNDSCHYDLTFIWYRFKTLASVLYPFIITVTAYWSIADSSNIKEYWYDAFLHIMFLCKANYTLPDCGHLWLMSIIFLCYIIMYCCSYFNKQLNRLHLLWGGVILLLVFVLGFCLSNIYIIYH